MVGLACQTGVVALYLRTSSSHLTYPGVKTSPHADPLCPDIVFFGIRQGLKVRIYVDHLTYVRSDALELLKQPIYCSCPLEGITVRLKFTFIYLHII